MNSENVKVGAAFTLGFGAPATNLAVSDAEPVLKVVLLLVQIAVAVATTLFILRKWKNAEKPAPKRRRKK